MTSVNNEEKVVQDENCWNCGKIILPGKLFVQVVVKKIVDHEDYWSFDEAGMNPYGQFCIQCLLESDVKTSDGELSCNLDACIPDWRLQI